MIQGHFGIEHLGWDQPLQQIVDALPPQIRSGSFQCYYSSSMSFFMFPLLLVANPFGEFMIESYISLPILTYQCFIYMIIYICVYACIIQNYDTKASAYPLCHGKTMGYLCLFSHKEVWSSHCHTRGQCTTGESHHFCAISVLLKNHHTMVQRWNHNLELSTSMGRPSWLYKVMVIHWKITGVSAGYPGYPQGKPRSATGSTRPCAYPSTSAPSIPWILCCWAIASAPA